VLDPAILNFAARPHSVRSGKVRRQG
jgi:hypothetical protein